MAERWVGSVRRELLDHVVIFNQLQLHRLLTEYVRYYHENRCHLTLEKDTPNGRVVSIKTSADAQGIALPRVGGLQHRYEWRQAA
ncbi:MAG TPA: integrase [Candidatus Paceibacterota bacterium]|nr:integrase [Candidatus Paceibacterota bacterium]